MALNASTAWEVQGTVGNSANGAGFDPVVSAGAGTDWTLAGTPHVTINGSTVTCTVHTTTTQVNLVGYTVATTDRGNIVNFSAGTLTLGRYCITAVDTANNRWTLDRSAGTAAQTASAGRMGGAFATIAQGIAAMTLDYMVCYVKADATYQITTALGAPSGLFECYLIGYATTHGDGGQATVAVGTGAGINALTTTTNFRVYNFIFDGTATSGSQGLIGWTTTVGILMVNCRIHHFANEGIKQTSASSIWLTFCEIDHCGGTNGAIAGGGASYRLLLHNCYVHDNSAGGVYGFDANSRFIRTIIANNTGIGVSFTGNEGLQLDSSLIYGNGSDGVRFADRLLYGISIRDSIFAKNGGYGINRQGTAWPQVYVVLPSVDFNAYWSNTSGPLNQLIQGAHDVVLTGVDPTNDPFMNKAAQDWRLNGIANAGALLRGAGSDSLPGLVSITNVKDIGPYQHAGGGGGLVSGSGGLVVS